MVCTIYILILLKLFSTSESSSKGCIHGGVKFNHGDRFLPNENLVEMQQAGQCVQCRCEEGMVICEMESCNQVICDSPIRMNHHCCPQCPGVSRNHELSSNMKFQASTYPIRSKNGCVSGGKYHKEGATWQPLIGPLGFMACVQCSCRSKQVTCHRFKCYEPPCSRPKHQFGSCCPVCPLREDRNRSSVNCLPRASEVFVYKTPTDTKRLNKIEFGFLQDSTEEKMEVHTWDTNSGPTTVSALTVSFSQKTDVVPLQLILIGATSYKHWIRYVRREKRLQHRCAVQCAAKLTKLEQTLKTHPVVKRTRCHSDEFETINL